MTTVRLVSKLLKFKGFRAVSFWFEGRGGRDLVVAVKPHKTGCRCPQCGRRGKIVHILPPRRWRDVRVCGRTVWLQHRPREIRCPTHGRRVEMPPWAEPTARTSYRFEYLPIRREPLRCKKGEYMLPCSKTFHAAAGGCWPQLVARGINYETNPFGRLAMRSAGLRAVWADFLL